MRLDHLLSKETHHGENPMESVGRHRQVLFSFERTNSQQFFENYIEEESKKDFIKEISYASEGNSNEKVKVKVKILRAYGGCLGDIC